MLPQLHILIAQSPYTVEYLDLDESKCTTLDIAIKKRFVCSNPRFATDHFDLFCKIVNVCKPLEIKSATALQVPKPLSFSDPIINNPPLALGQNITPNINLFSLGQTAAQNKIQLSLTPNFNSGLASLSGTPNFNQVSFSLPGGNNYKTLSARPILGTDQKTLQEAIDAKSTKNLQKCFDNLHKRGGNPAMYLNLDTGNLNQFSTIRNKPHKDDSLLIGGTNKEVFDFIKAVIKDFEIETPSIEGFADETKIDKKLRARVWMENNGTSMISKCYCCDNELKFTDNYEAGHIIARAKGGSTDISNLKPVCRTCNRSMGTTHMKEYAISKGYHGRIIK
jgi:hypothetical protein